MTLKLFLLTTTALCGWSEGVRAKMAMRKKEQKFERLRPSN